MSAVFISDSFSVCLALIAPKGTTLQRTFKYLVPLHLIQVTLIWVPGNAAGTALSGTVIDIVPPQSSIMAARNGRMLRLQGQRESALLSMRDFFHLNSS